MSRIDLSARICNGRLTQIGQAFKSAKNSPRSAVFQCECGKRTIAQTYSVKTGTTLSCGCLSRELSSLRTKTHGHASGGRKTPTFVTWDNMVKRCREKAVGQARKNYYDRGIRVCDRWLRFENFLEDMGEKPVGLTLERKDNDGNYCKENCLWIPHGEQARNTRRTIMVQVNGVLLCAAEAARQVGMRPNTLMNRIRQGWTPERAILTPVREKVRNDG